MYQYIYCLKYNTYFIKTFVFVSCTKKNIVKTYTNCTGKNVSYTVAFPAVQVHTSFVLNMLNPTSQMWWCYGRAAMSYTKYGRPAVSDTIFYSIFYSIFRLFGVSFWVFWMWILRKKMKMKKKYIWVGLKHWVGRSSTTKHLFFFGLVVNIVFVMELSYIFEKML